MYLQGKQIFRIYVNRLDPTKFRILLSKGPMFRRWVISFIFLYKINNTS